ncbi:vault protein inter-alpha-trypsin domain-domain-containing protein [Aspergillus taichungensis]|uniref:Vault protein inter-alpha-trypsin domain-domain-containing protein n=1 Tax=Aspergillus taichungensis TaxID=482145 RepID=A0A2J5I220_9EURO|nr:vault protein inter-alpha-trypsin domain-domain-containing protein [Aspergillus taichungensis]
MDAVDRLQSGLFFRRLNAVESAASVPQHPTVSESQWDVLVDVDIHGRLCTTKVTQQFSNASASTTQNAKYVFPIYDGWAVTSFRCWIGTDKLLEGAVKAKEAARADFRHAVSQREAAVLVEEVAPEVFETNVGNIPAQTTVKIEITYVNLLKIDNSTGGLVLTIPTSIAPRYGLPPARYTSSQPLPEDGLRINIQASMPAAIRKMESRSHPISVEMGKASHNSFKDFAAGVSSDTVDYTKGQATLADRLALLDKDFVFHILSSSREALQSRAIAATQPGQPTRSTIAVTMNPGDLFRYNANVGGFDGEIIFIVDRSGSMESKIPSLVDCTWLWPSSQRYSRAALNIASKHIRSFQADYGGTEVYGALESVLEHHNKRSDIPTSVILLTDGEVWDVDNVIRLVQTTSSNKDLTIRFFSLGIGDQVSHRLVEGIGQQGAGYAEVVPESGMGSWQERVIQMLKAALTPSRLQCAVDLGQNHPMKTCFRKIAGCQVRCPEFIQTPHHIPLLNTFSDLSLYYIVEGGLDSLPKTINVTATSEKGETLTAQLPVRPVAGQSAIHHLAAKALINDYETQRSWLHSLNPALKTTNPAGFDDVVEHEAQHLGQAWCIPSRWTSYVAVDSHTTEHHVVTVQRAAAIEVLQLTQPRYPSSPRFPGYILGSAVGCYGKSEIIDFDSNNSEQTYESSFEPISYTSAAPTYGPDLSALRVSSSLAALQPKQPFCMGIADCTDNDDGLISFDGYHPEVEGESLDLIESSGHMVLSSVNNVYDPSLAKRISESTGGHYPDQSLSDIPTLDMILCLQEADGEFNAINQSFVMVLGQKYRSEIIENFLKARLDHLSSASGLHAVERLRCNFLIVIHIIYEHAASKALWELQIAKARRWINQTFLELSKEDNASEESIKGPLEELELSVMTELQKQKDRQEA